MSIRSCIDHIRVSPHFAFMSAEFSFRSLSRSFRFSLRLKVKPDVKGNVKDTAKRLAFYSDLLYASRDYARRTHRVSTRQARRSFAYGYSYERKYIRNVRACIEREEERERDDMSMGEQNRGGGRD